MSKLYYVVKTERSCDGIYVKANSLEEAEETAMDNDELFCCDDYMEPEYRAMETDEEVKDLAHHDTLVYADSCRDEEDEDWDDEDENE